LVVVLAVRALQHLEEMAVREVAARKVQAELTPVAYLLSQHRVLVVMVETLLLLLLAAAEAAEVLAKEEQMLLRVAVRVETD
jgi:uncharacterized membrane protein YfhO